MPRRSKVRFAHNPLTVIRLGDFLHRSLAPPCRKKSRSLRLRPCKRGRGASASLPTFCGMRLRRGTLNRMFFIDDIRRSKVRFAHNPLTVLRLGDFSHRSLAPPLPQKVTLASAAPLQARARRLRFATNFLRHAPSARDAEPDVFYRRYTQEQSPACWAMPFLI